AGATRPRMTADTQPKTAQTELEIAGTTVHIGGMSKGSGMNHPNMATLLAYVTTDAAVEPGLIARLVRSVADRSFNQVTIDGDSSTNDSFLILANGAAGNEPIRAGSAEAEQLRAGLIQVARDLSRAIARDGEGATKLITVKVQGAASDGDARAAARAVASSSLVEALPYIKRFHGQIVVIKVGGNAIDHARDETLLDIVLLRYVGMQPVLVHGGGPEISAMSERLGLKPEFKNGLRITDEKTMEVVKMVLTGKVSPDLVAAIHRLGGQAVGMSGEDGPTIIA